MSIETFTTLGDMLLRRYLVDYVAEARGFDPIDLILEKAEAAGQVENVKRIKHIKNILEITEGVSSVQERQSAGMDLCYGYGWSVINYGTQCDSGNLGGNEAD